MTELGLRIISSIRRKSVRGMLKLEMFLEKLLQKGILLCRNSNTSSVLEGHFAVIAEDGKEAKRFVVPLRCLKNQAFLRLLEQSAEEHGYDQVGALTIPCRPSELEMLLTQQRHSNNKRVVNHG